MREAETTIRLKPVTVPCNEREMQEPKLAGKARFFIVSAKQQLSARSYCSHVRTRRDAYLASLTPLTAAARAEMRKARACTTPFAQLSTRVGRTDYASRNNGRIQ